MKDFLKGTVTPKDWMFVGIVLAITVVLAAAFYLLIHTKKQEQIAVIEKEIAERNLQLKEARATKLKMDEGEFELEANKMAELVERFDERLPEEREIPRMLGQFESKAFEVGLEGYDLKPMRVIQDANKEILPYQVTARGTFHEIVNFINQLERNQTYLKISDIDIGEEEDGVSEASFVMSTFRFTGEIEEVK